MTRYSYTRDPVDTPSLGLIVLQVDETIEGDFRQMLPHVRLYVTRVPSGAEVTPEDLRSRGLVKHRGRIKVLAEGDIDHAITVQTHAVSAAARSKIEAAGGSVEVVTE